MSDLLHIFVTADAIGSPTGGGKVTAHELSALATMPGGYKVFRPACDASDPFKQDEDVLKQLLSQFQDADDATYTPGIAHVYAGCFTKTCQWLHHAGWKVSYTVAAHDVKASKKAHDEAGWGFPYPHLTDPDLFEKYIGGYKEWADVVIVPSTHSRNVVRSQGRKGDIEIIPHGVDIPADPTQYRGTQFRVGYMGAIGPDKGLLTLFRAWSIAVSKLPTNSVLCLAGRDSQHPIVNELMRQADFRGACYQSGWVDSVSDFFSRISVYCQPSRSEGYGLEVTEALANKVPVVCSRGAGACDHVRDEFRFDAGDHGKLSELLVYCAEKVTADDWWTCRSGTEIMPWGAVEARYRNLWTEMLQ